MILACNADPIVLGLAIFLLLLLVQTSGIAARRRIKLQKMTADRDGWKSKCESAERNLKYATGEKSVPAPKKPATKKTQARPKKGRKRSNR